MTAGTLWANRNRLVAWQAAAYSRPAQAGVMRLHLGSGRLRYPGYQNVDLYEPSADIKADMCDLPMFKDNSVDDISCHHALEHVPLNRVGAALCEWYRILKPGGRLDLGLPDLELLMLDFLNASEDDKWGKFIYQIYGLQSSIYDTSNKTYEPGQVHQSGLSARRLRQLLEAIGFKIIELFNYDANGCASSVWVLAEKVADGGRRTEDGASALEQDAVMGVFTHRTTYLPALLDSVRKHLPHLPMIVQVADLPINANMERLRLAFRASGKRYWIYLDDDIQFLNSSIIHDAISDVIAHGWAACGVHSTFDPQALERPYKDTLALMQQPARREAKWATGYFILVDSKLVGDIQPDLNLPHPNTSVDTSYSVRIRAAGYTIGISPNVVYHQRKDTPVDMDVVARTNQYLMEKWGQFYFDWAQYDGNVCEWPISAFRM
jgi:predicted SAM-dependent methyltransferase